MIDKYEALDAKTAQKIWENASLVEQALYWQNQVLMTKIGELKEELDELKSLICRKVGSQKDE